MKLSLIPALLALFLSAVIAGANTSAPSGAPMTGRYILIEHVKDIDAFDVIEFHPDGSCKVDYNGSTGVAAAYKFGDDGKITITTADRSKAFTCGVKRQKISLILSNNSANFYYALAPDIAPSVTLNNLIGIFDTHNSLGDYATEITSDHHYQVHIRDFDPQSRTYFEVYTHGTCSLSNGIVTYLPEQSLGSQVDIFIKDILAKRDARGVWVIDPVDDKELLETPAKDMTFPPPRAGYRPAAAP